MSWMEGLGVGVRRLCQPAHPCGCTPKLDLPSTTALCRWFRAQGLMGPKSQACLHRAPSAPAMHRQLPSPARRQLAQGAQMQQQPTSTEMLQQRQTPGVMLVCDFDKTIIDYDAGERCLLRSSPLHLCLLARAG
jgi:hypothetical protein